MGDRFQSAAVLKLPLELLQRHDLCWRCRGDSEHLAQQCGTPYRTQRKHIAADRRFDNGVAYVGAPAGKIFLEFDGAGVRPETDQILCGPLRREMESLCQSGSGPMAQSQTLEAAS